MSLETKFYVRIQPIPTVRIEQLDERNGESSEVFLSCAGVGELFRLFGEGLKELEKEYIAELNSEERKDGKIVLFPKSPDQDEAEGEGPKNGSPHPKEGDS